MQLAARALRYLANRYLTDPHRPNQNTARANAADASARLRKRSQEQAEVDAYLREWRRNDRGADATGTSQGAGAEHVR